MPELWMYRRRESESSANNAMTRSLRQKMQFDVQGRRMSRFKIPSSSSYERSFEMLVEEINSLRDRLQALEQSRLPAVRTFLTDPEESILPCRCDVDYVGAHRWDCKYGRARK